jgi:hypothetical protein
LCKFINGFLSVSQTAPQDAKQVLNLDEILPQPGILPPRPETLIKQEVPIADSTDNSVISLLQNGKVTVYGGLSLIGPLGNFVYMVGVLQAKDENLFGWTLSIGHPDHEHPDFQRIDTTAAQLTELPFPNTMAYFVSEGDQRLVAGDVPSDDLKAVARFVLPFISDEGPPKGIDW